MSQPPKYLYPGFLSMKSHKYIERSFMFGEAEAQDFKRQLITYESYCLGHSWQEGLCLFYPDIDQIHYPFLQELAIYIKAIADAERLEQLMHTALKGGSDGIRAHRILMRMDDYNDHLSDKAPETARLIN